MTSQYDDAYISGLPRFVSKKIRSWGRQKSDYLELKFKRNYEAVTNRDFRVKTWKKEEGEGWRSTSWIGFVRVKVWSFYSVLIDTVLKAGKIPFSLQADPDDEDAMDEMMIKERDRRIERMTSKIESQLAQRKADRQYLLKWLSGGYYGMAFSRFNISTMESLVFRKVDMDLGNAGQYLSQEETTQFLRFEPTIEKNDVPGHDYVSVWDMVWDMEGGGLQPEDGSSGYAQRTHSSPYDLRQLIGKPGYIKESIERVIRRNKDNDGNKTGEELATAPGIESLRDRIKGIQRYEFYMLAPRKLVDEFEKLMKSRFNTEVIALRLMDDYEDAETSGHDVEIMGEVADKEIIRFIRNETKRRPHHMWIVEQNLDESTGMGIADNMESVQESLIGMFRAFEDNKKLSANVTAAVKERYFVDPSHLNDVKPGEKYQIADDCDDVRKALMPIVFPDVGESLMSGIQLMMQVKDDVSMIPTIMQGFTLPKHAPDTAYEMRQLHESAGKYIGQAIRNNDEQFIEPEIRDIYEYNMLYDDDETCKVNCKIIANGFTSFQNKEIRGERMKQAVALFVSSEVLLPYCEIKPHLDIIYESMDEDPDKFIKSEEKMLEESQQRAEAEKAAQEQAKEVFVMEAAKETEAKKLEHKHKLYEAEQKHVQEMELATHNANLNKIKESHGGSNG